MSTQYLSFGSIAELHNNNLITTSPLGELSNKARTYAKDPGVFSGTTGSSPTVLYNFYALENGVEVKMPDNIAEVEVNLSNWLYNQSKIGNINDNRNNTLSQLQTNFSSNIEITDVGEMVTDNQLWLPSFVQGKHLVGGEEHDFIIWYAEEYFRTQYPHVSFTIVHPIPLDEIDTLMTMNYQQIAERFARETPDIVQHRTNLATSGSAWPFTEREVIGFEILDHINTGQKSLGYWTYLSWGNGADSEDLLFEQIQTEILANSQYSRAEWEEKIPDLFNPLEFYVIPNYDRKGLINMTNGASQYSPIIDYETMRNLVDHYLTPHVTEEHLIESFQVVPWLYKSLTTGIMSKINNREGRKKFYDLFPDYSLISSHDSDFGQLTYDTTNMIINMEGTFAAAERLTNISVPPVGVTRIERFDALWASKSIGNVRFLVLTKHQMIKDNLLDD